MDQEVKANAVEVAPEGGGGRPSRARKRADETRRRLLSAAMALFCEKGLDATTIEDITERADLGKGTLYRYFGGKDEVMIALVDDAVSRLIGRLSTAKEPPLNLEEALARLLDAHCEFFRAHRDDFVLLFQGRLLIKLGRDAMGGLEEPFRRYLEEIGKQVSPFVAGPVAPLKVHRLAYAVAGFVAGFFSFAMIGMEAAEIEECMQPLRRAFLSACLAFLLNTGLRERSTVAPVESPQQPYLWEEYRAS